MTRLEFTIPDFVRISWVSEIAQSFWEPKIRAINSCWPYVERLSILERMRAGALQTVSPEALPELQNWALESGLGFSIVAMEREIQAPYGNQSAPYIYGEPFTYRVYLGRHPREFRGAWTAGDNLTIGENLGFPVCCTEFFDLYWRQEGWRDLTFLAGHGEIRNLFYNNVLLRHLGVRPIFHLPCSYGCRESCQIGIQVYDLMKNHSYPDEAEWLRELVSMPMDWSSLHGIAITTTPIFRLIYNSDALSEKASVKLVSDHYPEHGATGNKFPFVDVRPLKLINGFRTKKGMQEAHKFILGCLPKELEGPRVLDLGCGDGQLLHLIGQSYPKTLTIGVENQEEIVKRAVKNGTFYHLQDIYDFKFDVKCDLTLIAIQRLFESSSENAERLLKDISGHTHYLVLYSYNGWFHGMDAALDTYFKVLSIHRDSSYNYEAILLESRRD